MRLSYTQIYNQVMRLVSLHWYLCHQYTARTLKHALRIIAKPATSGERSTNISRILKVRQSPRKYDLHADRKIYDYFKSHARC